VQTTSEERDIRPGDPRCTHDYPILVTKTETGCYARCLKCLTEGPERPFSEAARFALVASEGRRGTRQYNCRDRVQRYVGHPLGSNLR
jgi:hypothetical protein